MLEYANPFNRRGFFVLPHVTLALLAGVALLIAFLAGAFAGATYGPSYYAKAYTHFIHVPARHERIPNTGGTTATGGAVYQAYLWAPGNQGYLNSCVSETFSKQIAYTWNWRYPHHYWFFSPRWFYDLVTGGRNIPTNVEDYNPALARHGAVRNKTFPYPPVPDAGNPTPATDVEPALSWVQQQATSLPMWRQDLFTYPGAGYGAVTALKNAIATKHLPSAALEIDKSAFDAAATSGAYLPPASFTSDFGHDMVVVRFDDAHRFSDGESGGFLFQNQYGSQFGVNFYGIRDPNGNNGYVWVPYRVLASVGYSGAVQHYGNPPAGVAAATAAPPHKAPPAPPAPLSAGGATAVRLEVVGLRTADTGVDISAAINRAAALAGVSAPGYASLIGVESAFHQYAPHYPIVGAGRCDYSGGLTQITVCTAAGLGIGDGSESQSNINYVLNYEQGDARRDVTLSGRLVAGYHRQVCWDFEPLYAAWNEGPGYGCNAYEYAHPSNWITQNAVADYQGWWNWLWANHHVRYATPAPTFNKSVWQEYRTEHHRSVISFRQHGKLTWAASIWRMIAPSKIGGILHHERWYGPSKHRRYGFTKTSFQGAAIFSWPHYHAAKVVYHRWIR